MLFLRVDIDNFQQFTILPNQIFMGSKLNPRERREEEEGWGGGGGGGGAPGYLATSEIK